jgi:glycosyltransferase involved in cell wall biosynthesis
MKILVNASTLVTGGALQVAVSLISEIAKDPCGETWEFVVSKEVAAQLGLSGVAVGFAKVTVVTPSPAQSWRSRGAVRNIERVAKPDVVLTIFGPAYVRFRAPHICGVANPWVTHASKLAYRKLGSAVRIFNSIFGAVYKAAWYRRADAWIVEAACAKDGLAARLMLPSERIITIPNNCGAQYLRGGVVPSRPRRGESVRMLYLSAYYAHKNFELIPRVLAELNRARPDQRWEMLVTLPAEQDSTKRLLALAAQAGVVEQIRNLGPVAVSDGPCAYEAANLCFMPSLLECFSANYPEAMAMRRPIVTSDLPFARDVCADAAVYFNADDAKDAARALLNLVDDAQLWERCLAQGTARLQQLPTPREKYLMYLAAIRETARGESVQPAARMRGAE